MLATNLSASFSVSRGNGSQCLLVHYAFTSTFPDFTSPASEYEGYSLWALPLQTAKHNLITSMLTAAKFIRRSGKIPRELIIKEIIVQCKHVSG